MPGSWVGCNYSSGILIHQSWVFHPAFPCQQPGSMNRKIRFLSIESRFPVPGCALCCMWSPELLEAAWRRGVYSRTPRNWIARTERKLRILIRMRTDLGWRNWPIMRIWVKIMMTQIRIGIIQSWSGSKKKMGPYPVRSGSWQKFIWIGPSNLEGFVSYMDDHNCGCISTFVTLPGCIILICHR